MAATRRIFLCNDVCRCFGGAVAQLGERLVRNEEVRGSNPLGSTNPSRPSAASVGSQTRSAKVAVVAPPERSRTFCFPSRSVLAGFGPEIDYRILQRNDDFAVQALRLKGNARRATELGRDAAFDQLGAEAALRRVGNRWPTVLEPSDAQNRTGIVGTHR